MAPSKPSLEMLRALTDENVLRTLMDHPRLTRAEIAARTGISRPTISDSVLRLSASGLVADTGERTTGRGRVGSYYALAASVGAALVAGITPHGVTAEAVDAHGTVLARSHSGLGHNDGPQQAALALASAVDELAAASPVTFRTAVVSAADPVDRDTGRLVHLPDAPFLVGDLDPPTVLAPHVQGAVFVDNDVNWAARAEHHQGCAAGVADFVHLHLGEGLGCAVVNDGTVRRGHHGLVGEIAHLWTVGPGGTAMMFTDVFAALGLRRPASTAIDTATLTARLAADDDEAAQLRAVLARAVGGVLSAAVALADPRMVILGGEWGGRAGIAAAVSEQFARTPRPVPVVAATLTSPELVGARARAVEELRSLIVRSAAPLPSDAT
ncbi:ROK family transcriptional regulator [Streptomyces acidicola]|uniref:ROK family transcriptional regulator n=1 Tax=Streptomyces acidicola TaxID=2596892 RepID=A0A5N8WIS9_9ACTN|nr:ROK family transcriptional regulator [Streptomyces acidicola]MPY47363.1 ROK family transcriptional regulator [Streptomyces acidicola]